jgi:hypothetical protein
MPDKMPEDMSDRMPEDLPVTKRINVMVGITRSKVFFGDDPVVGILPHGGGKHVQKQSDFRGIGFSIQAMWCGSQYLHIYICIYLSGF